MPTEGAGPAEPTEGAGPAERPDDTDDRAGAQHRYVALLERLLALQATTAPEALEQAAQLVVVALGTDKIDAFLYDAARDALVAVGVSETPMGRHERALGLDVLPLTGGGRTVEVFQTGVPYTSGQADQDPQQLAGVTQGLGIRSMMMAPLVVAGARRGVLAADSAQPEAFSTEDLHFLQAMARWLGLVAHRIEAEDARRAAEAAVQVRDDFLTAAAHDLRTPLTSLHGRAQLMQWRLARDEAPDRVWLQEQMAAVSAATTQMIALVEEIADVAHLQIGQALELHRESVDLGALVRSLAAEASVGTEGVTITVEVPSEPVVVVGDRARLQRVLQNVLANAVKFSPAQTPIHLAVRAPAWWVTITVADQGVGIPADELPRLFTRFYRASTATGVPGSGLGLWGAQAIVAQHGGTIRVESVVGQGTTVVIALPRVPNVADGVATAPPAG